ncbi:MAG TPA: class I mannose-6-phosphate isomerase [Candidatus Hydrogenedentes bacterium]|nr:class I mannose-6-phosphate isomerase [Candidatus Hydrogenedentota bacterium]
MNAAHLGLLRFEERYHERIWGGNRLGTVFGKPIPSDKPIGEAWLVSDHAACESVVASGPHKGKTLRALLEADAPAVLGARAELTIHGRFPLLLKILDAREYLSVQVHPDDACAKSLGEPDVGKTEMWHVLGAERDSELICGLRRSARKESFAQAVGDETIEELMMRFPVQEGTSVFVPSGTVHAIGAGVLLAEIQQNSNLTYRLYDWGRVQADGTMRELHVDKALKAVHFESRHGGAATPLGYDDGGARRTVLAVCRHFAAELIELGSAPWRRATRSASFHILLCRNGTLAVSAGNDEETIRPGEAVLAAGGLEAYAVAGEGDFLDYYVPDLECDVVAPLESAGHSMAAIVRLGGEPNASDLRLVRAR